jgi:hypothetical protein
MYMVGKSQLGEGGNPRTNKSVLQRMTDCQSQLSFSIFKKILKTVHVLFYMRKVSAP